MGETSSEYPLDFEPQCPQFAWMLNHLGGWQFGEQDLIPAILKQIGAVGLCIEYGAGDGDVLPLTIDRLYQDGRDCCLVEINEDRQSSLRTRYPNASVTGELNWGGHFVTSWQIPAVVVIDIDGQDSVVMRQMLDSKCRPALIVCEHMDRHFNIGSTTPHTVPQWLLGMELTTGHIIQDTAETLHWIAGEMGYERVGLNRCNSFFVRKDLFGKLFL